MSSRALAGGGLLGCVVMAAGAASSFLAASQAADRPVATVQSVTVTSGRNRIEVEIAASQPVAMHSQVATHPDRLVLDFAGALPGRSLRNQAINRGEVKGIRVGLFTQNPLVTRVVIDLKNAQPYRIYRADKAVIVKLMMKQNQAAIGAKVDAVSYKPVASKPQPKVEVEYKNEQLSIWADNASLADVLGEVARKTGADIPLPAMAAQEQVAANIGPLPVTNALAALLNGSRFNFILVGSERDPAKLKRVILTFRGTGLPQSAIDSAAPVVVGSQPEPEDSRQPETQPQPQEGPGEQENSQHREDPGQQQSPQPQEGPPP
jgi:hypothetical protein